MKINYLHIEDWGILKRNDIRFKNKLSVIIGENGSGKSSLIEMITLIFGHLYKYFVENKLNDDFIEGYIIDYSININGKEHNIVINSISYQASSEEDGVFKHSISIDGEDITRKEAEKKYKRIGGFKAFLPNTIVLYYAGISTHISDICSHFDEKYRKSLTKEGNSYNLNNLPKERPFFYSDYNHISLILLCLLISNKKEHNSIPRILNIDPLEVDIKIELKEPNWKKAPIEDFWGASNGAINDFLRILNKYSHISEFKDKKIIFHYIGVLNFRDMIHNINTNNLELFFLEMFDILLYNDLLSNISLSWKNKENNTIELNRLSEGEKQMILTAGLSILWGDKNCLLLLDEPDTFLHPKWQVEFLPNLEENLNNNQIIITSHSPLLISSIKNGDLLTMKHGKSFIYNKSTYGKETNSILKQTMNSSIRVQNVNNRIIEIEKNINNNNLELAKQLIQDLELLMNDNDDSYIIRLLSIIKRKEIIGK